MTSGKELVAYAALPSGPKRDQGRLDGLPVVRGDEAWQG